MDFYEVIEKRKSLKSFKKENIDQDKLNRIINAAMRAPSWRNKTSYKFIMVDDSYEKDRISETILNKDDSAKRAVKEAPMLAVIASDPSKSGDVDGKAYYMADAAIAMEHFVLAATNEGYGTCWIGSLDENKLKSILNIPQEFRVVAITPIGVPEEEKAHQPEKDVKEHIFLNVWENPYIDTLKH